VLNVYGNGEGETTVTEYCSWLCYYSYTDKETAINDDTVGDYLFAALSGPSVETAGENAGFTTSGDAIAVYNPTLNFADIQAGEAVCYSEDAYPNPCNSD
jgi:hypothetical protein